MAGGSVGRVGVAAFAFALAVPFVGAGRGSALISIADAEADSGAVDTTEARTPRVRDLRSEGAIAVTEEVRAAPIARAPEPTTPPATAPEPPVSASVVLASWYGPGFYGNRTACGLTYTAELIGVAHRTLPCGTLLTLSYGARSVVVTVIDRGPYVAGRTLDLSNATRNALGCPDLCTLSMRQGP